VNSTQVLNLIAMQSLPLVNNKNVDVNKSVYTLVFYSKTLVGDFCFNSSSSKSRKACMLDMYQLTRYTLVTRNKTTVHAEIFAACNFRSFRR